jgi:hypothetical protein
MFMMRQLLKLWVALKDSGVLHVATFGMSAVKWMPYPGMLFFRLISCFAQPLKESVHVAVIYADGSV